jgi:hypothetical protein
MLLQAVAEAKPFDDPVRNDMRTTRTALHSYRKSKGRDVMSGGYT